MRYVFFGSKDSPFAQIILDGLSKAGFPPAAAFQDAKAPLDADYLKSLKADFFLVASFGKILKKEILGIPPRGAIGVHPSLLPKYRGPSPIQSTILNNEKETGVTLFLIDEKVDHGPILANSKLQIADSDTYETLLKKLAKVSIGLILETIPKWLKGEIEPQVQNESQATYTRKFIAEGAKVDLKNEDPKQVWLKIRALNPEPGTFTILKLKSGKELRLKLLEADFDGKKLNLEKVQPEGKKAMSYVAFLNGYQTKINNL